MRTTRDRVRFCPTAGASALGNRRFLNCVWELTYRCNARCSMCSYWESPERLPRRAHDGHQRQPAHTPRARGGSGTRGSTACSPPSTPPTPRRTTESAACPGPMTIWTPSPTWSQVRSCPGCWYCFRGESDGTLSPGGCTEKVGSGIRIMRRNAARAVPGVRSPPGEGRSVIARVTGDRRGASR